MITAKYSYRKYFFFITAIFLMGIAAPLVSSADTCIDCHKNDNFRVQNKMLYDYYNNWKDSRHDLAGVTCIDCHGGNPEEKSKEAAHKVNESPLGRTETDAFKKIPVTCGRCHQPELESFRQSMHYRALIAQGTGPHCVTCHGSMNVEVYYTSMIAMTCKVCHNEYTKNRPEIVGEADKILHRINVSRSFKNWVTIYYSDKEPEEVRKITGLYNEIAASWHTFDFAQLDEKSQDLLQRLKSMVNRALAERRKKQG